MGNRRTALTRSGQRQVKRNPATTSTPPTAKKIAPITAQNGCPVMKLPGSMPTPCNNQTPPTRIINPPAISSTQRKRYLRFRDSGLEPFNEPTKTVVDGGLDLLDARDVVRADDDRVIREPLADDPAPVIAHDANRQQPSSAGFGERGEDVGGAPAGRDTDRDVLGPRMSDELTGEDRLRAYVVGYGRYVGRLGR